MSAGPASGLYSAPIMDKWLTAPSRTIILVQTTRITQLMRRKLNSRTQVTMERSTDGTSKNMYRCIKTNIRFSKAWSNTAMLVLMTGPKSGICWTVSRPTNWIPQRDRFGLPPPYKTTSMTVLPCSKTFINNKQTATTHTSTIASIGTKRKRDNGDEADIEPDMSVDDRYYTGKEYAMLSKAKKLGLKLKCQKHGHKPRNKGKPRTAPKPMVGDRAMPCIIKALSKLIAAGGQAEEENINDTDSADHIDTNTNAPNWANRALQRRK